MKYFLVLIALAGLILCLFTLKPGLAPAPIHSFLTKFSIGRSAGDTLLNPDGTGKVGVGTSNPQGFFEVWGGRSRFVGKEGATLPAPPTSGSGLEIFFDSEPGHDWGILSAIMRTGKNGLAFKMLNIDASPLLINTWCDGNVGIGTRAPAANLDIHGTVKLFGARTKLEWNSRNKPTASYTIYQAATDGFVVISAHPTGSQLSVSVYGDTSSPPTTLLGKSDCEARGGRPVSACNMTVPIVKGENYYIKYANSGVADSMVWVPLGQPR